MRFSKVKRLAALLLVLLMLTGPVTVFAEDGGSSAETGLSGLSEVSDELTFISYQDYLIKYLDVADDTDVDAALAAARTDKEFTVAAADYDAASTTAEVAVVDHNGRKCLSIGDEGVVTWRFNAPKTGFYTLRFNYCTDSIRNSTIEKILYINDKVPFLETRYISLAKVWDYEYPAGYTFGSGFESREGAFEKDSAGNEIRPKTVANTLKWSTYVLEDPDGYISGEFEYYLREGENTLTLQGVSDTCYIDEFTFGVKHETLDYEEYLAKYGDKKTADAEPIYINAEVPYETSNYTIYPITDRTSAITEPQDSTLTLLNTIGADKWAQNGQWIRYEITVEKSGLYVIAPRFKQSINEGTFSSRSFKIDGEIPFEEAGSLRFGYDSDWQLAPLCDDDGTVFQFYLEAGRHEIEFEACLGDMSEILEQAKLIRDSLNEDLLMFSKLTGKNPDENRSYGFMRTMPDTVADLSYQSQNLKIIMSNINQTSGIKSDATGTLEKMIELLRKMGADESKIAGNLSELQSQIGTFGEWIANMTSQPLELDYILIQPVDAELPDADANFFQSFIYEVKKFFASFFADYDSISEDEEGGSGYSGHIEAWTSAGREQAQIENNIIKNGFTKDTNVAVTVKLTADGTLLPSIIAGTGPDVSLDAAAPIDLAIRGAVVKMNDFDTYDEVIKRFPEAAMTQMGLYGETYAIPTTMGVPVMFYRTDILADLGLEVPETWDDLMSMVPVLQFNKMEIGVTFEFTSMCFQNGANWWKDDGMRTAFDESDTLDVFETICNYFTQYSLPVQFNGMNRMRTGEMPIFLGPYATYNYLVVSAPEIAGLWKFTEIPGTRKVDENGNEYVDHTAAATSTGIIIPRTVQDKELAWDFVDWYTGKDPQLQYCNDMVALLGPSAKLAVANLEAFESLPWSSSEREVFMTAFDHAKEIEIYPGDYIVSRHWNFSFSAVYNEGADPSDDLLSRVPAINEELTRKRKEFGYMVAEEWDAVKAYTGLDSYYDSTDGKKSWLEYAKQNGIEDYKDWMDEHGISAENYVEWAQLYKDKETDKTYREWVES